MERSRWLLPFTRVVDLDAIDAAVCYVKREEATLVVVSLVIVPEHRRARAEDLQQSQDFLEAVKWKAARYNLPLERYEVLLREGAPLPLPFLIGQLRCNQIVLTSRSERGGLTEVPQFAELLARCPVPYTVLHLLPLSTSQPITRLASWLRTSLRNHLRTAQTEGRSIVQVGEAR